MNDILKAIRLQWDRAGAIAAVAIGLLALFLGYRGVSGTPHVAAQLPYFISGGLLGIFALGVGSVLWISADMRDEWRELHALREMLEQDAGVNGEARTEPFEAPPVPVAANGNDPTDAAADEEHEPAEPRRRRRPVAARNG